MVVMPLFDIDLASDRWMPTWQECFWMAVLVLACTLFAYRLYVQLLSNLSVFTINFANNLEPVYGITTGILFFGDHRLLGSGFFVGGTIILATVLIQPVIASFQRPREQNVAG